MQKKTIDGAEKEVVNDVDFEEVSMFVLSLVIPSYVKRNMRFTPTFTTYDTFYECLYRYSHKRLEAALTIPAVACVFRIFLDGPTFKNLLQNDSTLSKNSEAYESAKDEFMQIINQKSGN